MNLPIVIVAAIAGTILGWLQRSNLNRRGYRYNDELRHTPPGPRWWVIPASTLTAATTAALATTPAIGWGWITLVPLAITGPWLAAVDFDVYRIPNRVLLPTAALTVCGLIGLASTGNSTQALTCALGGLISGALFAILHAITRGGIGFGDVKLVTVMGLALGPLGLSVVWVALITGPITAMIWAKATRPPGGFAYGPWLLLGASIATVAAAFTTR